MSESERWIPAWAMRRGTIEVPELCYYATDSKGVRCQRAAAIGTKEQYPSESAARIPRAALENYFFSSLFGANCDDIFCASASWPPFSFLATKSRCATHLLSPLAAQRFSHL
jgi:hypothetical protein